MMPDFAFVCRDLAFRVLRVGAVARFSDEVVTGHDNVTISLCPAELSFRLT